MEHQVTYLFLEIHLTNSSSFQSRAEGLSLLERVDRRDPWSGTDRSVYRQPVERWQFSQERRDTGQNVVTALGCKVLGLVSKERLATDQDVVAQYFTRLELPQLLSSVDYLINILPSTPDTDNILSKLVCVLLPRTIISIPPSSPISQSFRSNFLFW